jgi:hypothetical protein
MAICDSHALLSLLNDDLIHYECVASRALKKSLLKKFQDDKTSDADDVAMHKFLACNERCKLFNRKSLDPEVLASTRRYLYRWLSHHPDSTSYILNFDWLDTCTFGPGASRAARGTDFYTKSSSCPLTASDKTLYAWYIRSIRSSGTWMAAEISRRTSYEPLTIMKASKLCFVPKTREESRSICVEPTLNTFIQKGLQWWLERAIRLNLGIDFRYQPDINRRMARKGSIDGSYATIDLTSASDTISRKLMRLLLPKEVYLTLCKARTNYVDTPVGTYKLHMMGSMGNATTFPLQTLVFSSIVLSCYDLLGIPHWTSEGHRNWAVFGDDIIVTREAYDTVINQLCRFGFVPNLQKSFNEGTFRESCGEDYDRGINVRGVYCKTLRSHASIYSLINRLNLWSAIHSIPLPLTISYLAACVPHQPIPFHEQCDAGIYTPLFLDPVVLNAVRLNKNRSVIYKALVVKPKTLHMEERPMAKARKRYNAAGLLLCFVRGDIRDGYINLRMKNVSYTHRRRVTPHWDYVSPDNPAFGRVSLDILKSMIRLNLGMIDLGNLAC